MILLETYSTLNGTDLQQRLPNFLKIQCEVTGDPRYSMFNLSLKERWLNNKKFCQSLAGTGEHTSSSLLWFSPAGNEVVIIALNHVSIPQITIRAITPQLQTNHG